MEPQQTKVMPDLKPVLQQRFDVGSNSLTLANLGFIDFNSRKECLELFEAVQNFCPTVETIDFTGNNISSLRHFSFLKNACRNVKRLCFEKNSIGGWNNISFLDNLKDNLKELIFIENPIFVSDQSKRTFYIT